MSFERAQAALTLTLNREGVSMVAVRRSQYSVGLEGCRRR